MTQKQCHLLLNYATVMLAILCVILAIKVSLAGDSTNTPAKQLDANTEALATVRIYVQMPNHMNTGSGVIIHRGQSMAYGLTAAHVTNDQPIINVQFCNGSETTARIVEWDYANDLALFAVPTQATLASVPVASKEPKGPITACGYPRGQGPNYKRLRYHGVKTITDEQCNQYERFQFSVHTGTAFSGDSGGGVFKGGKLIGIITHQNRQGDLLAATCSQVNAFLAQVCQGPNCPPNYPPSWLQPNIKINPVPTPIEVAPQPAPIAPVPDPYFREYPPQYQPHYPQQKQQIPSEWIVIGFLALFVLFLMFNRSPPPRID